MSSGSRVPVSECYRFETSAVVNLDQPVSDLGLTSRLCPPRLSPFEDITNGIGTHDHVPIK